MTYWKRLSRLLLINGTFFFSFFNFFCGCRVSERRSQGERLTLVWSEVTGWPAARPRYLPLGSVFLLDILSLMNCHFFSFRITQRKWAAARTHPPSPWQPIGTFQLSCLVCTLKTAAATGAPPPEFLFSPSAACVHVCVLPSLICEHTHTCSLVTGSRCFLAQTQPPLPPVPPKPYLLQCPQTSVCCEATGRESWGNFRVDCWNRTRGPPQQSYITVEKKILLCAHMKNLAPFPLVERPIIEHKAICQPDVLLR